MVKEKLVVEEPLSEDRAVFKQISNAIESAIIQIHGLNNNTCFSKWIIFSDSAKIVLKSCLIGCISEETRNSHLVRLLIRDYKSSHSAEMKIKTILFKNYTRIMKKFVKILELLLDSLMRTPNYSVGYIKQEEGINGVKHSYEYFCGTLIALELFYQPQIENILI
uniref:RUN domain-containing protein n=1 Tax=Rhabditophanes sp. KR3021 TaxID=114890 RepID=A0AC35TM75_9BILA